MSWKSMSPVRNIKAMKALLRSTIVETLWAMLLVAVPLPAYVYAFDTITNIDDVRERGRSEPPFLNYTAPPNLLLLLDNSGSMLDMAYIDSSTKLVNGKSIPVNQCTDRTDTTTYAPNFDNSTEKAYTGYFDPVSWYQWTPGTITAWESGHTYTKDTLVYDNGIVYQCTTDTCSSTGTSLGRATNADIWMPIIQGATQQPPAGFTYANGTLSHSGNVGIDEGSFTVVSQADGCSSKDYSNSYVCVKFDSTATPTKVTNFAATGKFLNWLSASKFDIEKKVLTGGKYNAADQLLISESRGCAGSGFIKETTVKDSSNISKTLSFRVRGAESGNPVAYRNDKIAATDDTTRIELLGVIDADTSIINDSCKEVLADVMAGANLNSQSNNINQCLTPLRTAIDPAVSDQRPMLNHALQFCQKLFDGGTRNLNAAIGECEDLYETYKPWEIDPSYGAYACYGVYDENTNHRNRAGYMGRCWNAGMVPSADEKCTLVPATVNPPNPFIDATGNLYRNLNGHLEKCLDTEEKKGVYSCKKSTDWSPLYQINNSGEIYDSLAICQTHFTTTATTAAVGWLPPDPVQNINCTDYNDPAKCEHYDQCVFQGMVDYCKSLSVPEVIDPSDQATTTADFWNLPATLIDSGVIVALGTDRPLAVMKGRIKQATTPSGILQEKGLNLRIGAMKINPVGALYECTTGNTTGTVQPFCPADNKDGAQLIAPLALGSDAEPGNTSINHAQQVANVINEAQANTWTPLAEAVFSAMGYLTQRSDMCINPGTNSLSGAGPCWDFPIFPADNDPVQSPCQLNHLLIITEGSSTRDVNSTVTGSAAATYVVDGVVGAGQQCDPVLRGSTYLNNIAAFGYYSVPDRGNFSSDSAYEAALTEAEDRASLLYNGTGMSSNEFTDEGVKQGIITHIITTGSLRSDLGTVPSCDPATLMDQAAKNGGSTVTSTGKYYVSGENPDTFSSGLSYIFDAIMQRASTGSSASVVSSSRSGEGAVYQAIFWPELKSTEDTQAVTWAGDVHSLFIDGHGYMYEDTEPKNGKLDSGDRKVTVYYDTTENKSKGCYEFENNTCINSVDLDEIKYLWSANSWLQSITDQDSLLTNRSTYISSDKQRYIFTWNDLNGDGDVDEDTSAEATNEIIPFDTTTKWHLKFVAANRGPIFNDFGLTFNETNELTKEQSNTNFLKLVSWIRGNESDGYRNRTLAGEKYLLGDVIHSTPMVVASPQENFHLLYNDQSYEKFAAQYKNRRQVIYFGSNDGMLHAVNGGFYDSDKKMFCRAKECELTSDGTVENPTSVSSEPELGAELWAYVPYNLQPHLEYLAQPDYLHKYFVDLKPRVFDAQIFPDDEDHPNGWGTILVGGMRFGGVPVHAKELNGVTTDNRVFTSAYFVFDITNPEKPPRLLGEMNRQSDDVDFTGATGSNDVGTDMGYSTVIPTMVIMKKDGQPVGAVNNRWYLVFGSGPHSYRNVGDPLGDRALKGFSDQNAKLAVLPLDKLIPPDTTGSLQALRIPDSDPDSTNAGTIVVSDASRGFVSDLITVDFDISPTSSDYLADAVYFGTVEANVDDAKGGFDTDTYGTFWSGGGKLYRMVTRNLENDNSSYYVPSSQRSLLATNNYLRQTITAPDDWHLSVMMNPGRPITGAPSVAYDGNNFWVYFGTGRYFHPNDKTDSQQQAYYGLKEPMASVTVGAGTVKKFTWDTLSLTGTKTDEAGSKGLARVDNILVQQANSASTGKLTCWDDTTMTYDTTKSCYPSEIAVDSSGDAYFDDLTTYIAGTGSCATDKSNCADGWYKIFHDARERNLGQATILGGLVTFTTYEPYSDPCKSEGISNLYGVYFQTGTAWYENIFGTEGLDIQGNVKDRLELGLGLTTTPNLHVGGAGDDGVTAFVQTSTGEIKVIKQENLPIRNYKSGRARWKEYSR